MVDMKDQTGLAGKEKKVGADQLQQDLIKLLSLLIVNAYGLGIANGDWKGLRVSMV